MNLVADRLEVLPMPGTRTVPRLPLTPRTVTSCPTSNPR